MQRAAGIPGGSHSQTDGLPASMPLQKRSVFLNGGFNSLRLNADVALGSGGGAVLQKPLNRGGKNNRPYARGRARRD